MAELVATLNVGEEVLAIVEHKIAAAKEESEARRRETVKELQAALEVVQAAQAWARERRLPATAAERWLMDTLKAYQEYRTRYDENLPPVC